MSIRIPNLCDSARLAKLAQAGEPCVVLKAVAIGSTGEHEMLDKEGRVYRLKWSSQHGGHIIRIPISLWIQNKHKLAHDIMDQPLHLPLIALFEGEFQSQGGAEAARLAHTQEDAGSSPAPATISLEDRKELVAKTQELAANVIEAATATEKPTEEPGEAPIITAIKALLASGNKRVGDLATELPADEEMVREAIASENSGLYIGAAGWVKIGAQEG